MKKLSFILGWVVLLSCNSSPGAGNNSVTVKSDVAPASTNGGAGNGTITCTIDGKSKKYIL